MKDMLFERKVKLIRHKVMDYYLTFYDEKTAKIKTDEAIAEAINKEKIDFLYTKHIKKN